MTTNKLKRLNEKQIELTQKLQAAREKEVLLRKQQKERTDVLWGRLVKLWMAEDKSFADQLKARLTEKKVAPRFRELLGTIAASE